MVGERQRASASLLFVVTVLLPSCGWQSLAGDNNVPWVWEAPTPTKEDLDFAHHTTSTLEHFHTSILHCTLHTLLQLMPAAGEVGVLH